MFYKKIQKVFLFAIPILFKDIFIIINTHNNLFKILIIKLVLLYI